MKDHPDVGTDSRCNSALPCNSSFCCLLGSGSIFTGRASKLLHIGRELGHPAMCFHSDVPLVSNKGCADVRRAAFPSDRDETAGIHQ